MVTPRRNLVPFRLSSAPALMAAAAVVAFSSTALAEWKLSTTPDASFGGERTILAGQASSGAEIVALCNGDNHAFNLILPDWEKDLGGGRAMTLEISNDNGGLVKGPGTTFRSEVADFTGIAFDAPDRLEEIVRLIATAEASISIVSTNIDWGVSTTYYADVTQPVAEARAFAEACGFGTIPAVVPRGPTPAPWTVSAELGSPTLKMEGSIGEGMTVAFSCDTSQSASLVLTRSAAAGGAKMTEPVNATLVVDGGRLRTSPASIDINADGSATIYHSDSSLVPEVVIDLAAAKAKILLELYYPATETFEEWEAQGRVAVDAARHFVDACGLVPRPALDTAPDPRLAPATPGTWKMEEQTRSDGAVTQTLTARTATGDGKLILLCDEKNDISFTYITDDLMSMPIRQKGEKVSLHANMNGLACPLDLYLMHAEDGTGLFMNSRTPSIDAILAALREGPQEMELLFIDLATDSDIYERHIATDNVVAEADRFIAICHAE